MIKRLKYTFLLIGLLAFATFALAQTSGPTKEQIQILGANTIERDPLISDASRLLGNVKLGFGEAVLYCDSAYRFDNGRFEVFSSIKVVNEPNNTLFAEYAILNPEYQTITVREDVEFLHDEMSIKCPELIYDIERKLVSYYQRAQFVDGLKTLESNLGTYSSKSGRLYAGGNVIIEEGADFIASDSIAIDKEDQHFSIFKRTHIDMDGALINCSRGEFDGASESGWFSGNASIYDKKGFLAGDSIVVSQKSGDGSAWGNVVVKNPSKTLIVTGVYANRTNNIEIIHGDSATLAIATNIEEGDTLILGAETLRKSEDWLFAVGEVEFEQGAFSGEGDSLSWDLDADEVWLLGNPKVRSEEEELSGDSVKMIIDKNKPSVLSLIGNAMVLSYTNDTLQNKMMGKTLDAQFTGGDIDYVDIKGNGNILYYTIDDSNSVSINKATCSHIKMHFRNREVESIILLNSPEGSVKKLN
ncbi:MAG: hypothetical protein CL847_02625 [Crocinitomicaceae bacterium]|nr:hypothetical protein [Crocinitomicaceae bacterium]|tara:strand:- start:9674 stop:11089 length:1416 start_codon:yes stop_codon:yes gene_type:complete